MKTSYTRIYLAPVRLIGMDLLSGRIVSLMLDCTGKSRNHTLMMRNV